MIQYWSIIHEYIDVLYDHYKKNCNNYNEIISSYKRSIYDQMIDMKNKIYVIDTNHIRRRKLLLLQQIQEHNMTKRLWHIRVLLVSAILLFVLYDIVLIPTTNHIYDMNMIQSIIPENTNNNNNDNNRDDNNSIKKPKIDIISIGSLLKQQYQIAQQNTFANSYNNKSVRKYYRITERNDTDSTCYTTLTSDQLDSIIKFCHTKGKTPSSNSNADNENPNNEYNIQYKNDIRKVLFHDLYHPKKHTGYICSQKRMIDGLYNVLQKYYRTKYNFYQTQNNNYLLSLPDYMLLIEDDTYIPNINLFINDLKRFYPSHIPYAIAGCVRTSNTDDNNVPKEKVSSTAIPHPHTGYGTILTKAALERLLEPIYCNFNDIDTTTSNDNNSKKQQRLATQHSILACWRLQQNLIDELEFFVDGMSIIELMYTYAKQNLYTNIDQWKEKKKNNNNKTTNGYCLLSDTAFAYYMNYYHITVSDNTILQQQYNNQPNDYIRPFYSFAQLSAPISSNNYTNHYSNEATSSSLSSSSSSTTSNQCWLPKHDSICTKEQHICHKIKPEQMYTLYNQSNTKGI
jgi:hypothetical protein